MRIKNKTSFIIILNPDEDMHPLLRTTLIHVGHIENDEALKLTTLGFVATPYMYDEVSDAPILKIDYINRYLDAGKEVIITEMIENSSPYYTILNKHFGQVFESRD